MKIKQALLISLITITLCGCSSDLSANNNSKEYKPSFITVDSNTVPYKIAISNNEQIEVELQEEKDYQYRVEEYNNFIEDTKTNITEIVFKDSSGEVDWTETENGDIVYNGILFTDLKTNIGRINHSKYTSREIIDFIVHNFKTEDKTVFSRIEISDNGYSEESTSIFLDQFTELKDYRDFVNNHNNEDIAWKLDIYTYGYQHVAYLYGSNSYVISLSSAEKDLVEYTVQSHEPEQTDESLQEQSSEEEIINAKNIVNSEESDTVENN